MREKLESACRVAFAAYVHDLGKLAERARIAEADARDADGASVAERNKQLYCPWWNGRPSHVHAAYTAIALDAVEADLPPLTGDAVAPFAARHTPEADDSLVNAAAMHHRPRTFLQWIVATADRVASGFEREAFERYNRAEERPDHYRARLLTLFEQIRLTDEAPAERADLRWRHPLAPLSVEALFPRPAAECETADREAAQAEYRRLWETFREGLRAISPSHRRNWPLWLDHFDSLWATCTHAVPAATAGNVKPEVSLYDHSRTTAALATALWRWHDDRGDDPDAAAAAMRTRADWGEDKFLLILGDFHGIQEFIFAAGGETQRRAARLLRGRSFYVSLLSECAALKILDELGLPPTSQVINAAGKFLIVAPNTEAVRRRLAAIQAEFDRWFLGHTFATSGIGIAWEPACCDDFVSREKDDSPFRALIDRLFRRMETMKSRRFGLCGSQAPAAVFEDFLAGFDRDKGVCAIDGRSPGVEPLADSGRFVGRLAADQIDTGKWLAHHDRVVIATEAVVPHTLRLDLFGYRIGFADAADDLDAAGLRRVWDYRLPESADEVLFAGCARRHINAYVPLLGELTAYDRKRYQGIEAEDDPRAPKTFEHLARDDRRLEDGHWVGVEALTVLKGDVDNLGTIFEKGLARPSFAKWAALSRQMNAFFAVWLPWHCRHHAPGTYTVFAGGDDFFLVGPWLATIRLARAMRREFRRYVAENPDLHFSAGLLMTKPGLPVRQLGEFTEDALERAKALEGKNAVTLFGRSVPWDRFDDLWRVYENLQQEAETLALSTGYLYRLQSLARMAAEVTTRTENAIWKSQFAYHTWRLLERTRGLDDAARRRRMAELWTTLGDPIERFGEDFVIPLFLHLYQQRD